MKKLFPLSLAITACSIAVSQPALETMPGTLAQGGQGGRMMDATGSERIDDLINRYLVVPELKSILTPGEFSEWLVKLRAGQVVVCDARSEAFDPAIEITDEFGKHVFAKNDDRYPGDQRPLLLWECPADGTYSVRGRCFQNKSGGQFFLRYRVFNSVNVPEGPVADVQVQASGEYLFKIPMKKGQIKRLVSQTPQGYASARFYLNIGPNGLPDIGLSGVIDQILQNSIVAPVDGTYYVLGDVSGPQPAKTKIGALEILPTQVARASASVTSPGSLQKQMWSIDAKAGEFLQISTPKLGTDSAMAIMEIPDISGYDLVKPENNPFAPKTPEKAQEIALRGAAFIELPARDRDPRKRVIAIKRDCALWVATSGNSRKEIQYALHIDPGARAYTEGKPISSKLRIGDIDYWSFDAKVGEVMTFSSRADLFTDNFRLYDPNFGVPWEIEPPVDQTTVSRNLIVTQPGRYIAAVSGRGNGGGGDYTLTRTVYHPKEFGMANPAVSSIEPDQVQVWKVTIPAGKPVLLKWTSDAWDYSRVVHTEDGSRSSFPLIGIDANTHLALMKADGATTYLIVLTGVSKKCSYKIELMAVQGFGK